VRRTGCSERPRDDDGRDDEGGSADDEDRADGEGAEGENGQEGEESEHGEERGADRVPLGTLRERVDGGLDVARVEAAMRGRGLGQLCAGETVSRVGTDRLARPLSDLVCEGVTQRGGSASEDEGGRGGGEGERGTRLLAELVEGLLLVAVELVRGQVERGHGCA